jgi:hypothetical protein
MAGSTQEKEQLPALRGQWIDLVKCKGPIQLPNRPQQMIDSYVTIWQKGAQLWAGDGFGNVNDDGVVTMYDQQANYIHGEIVWPGQDGLNAYVRTVDLTGVWIDQTGTTHDLAQKNSPVLLNQTETVLSEYWTGNICGYSIQCVNKISGEKFGGTLSHNCFNITWSDGSSWQRHLHLQGRWISIKNKCQINIHCERGEVTIGGVAGVIDFSNWYVDACSRPFPDKKTKGGIDLDSTAIHWSDYIGWQRVFDLTGAWVDQSGVVHGIANQRIQNATDYRRFIWLFDCSDNSKGTLTRNWIELITQSTTQSTHQSKKQDTTMRGQLNFASNRIFWQDGQVWKKQNMF